MITTKDVDSINDAFDDVYIEEDTTESYIEKVLSNREEIENALWKESLS